MLHNQQPVQQYAANAALFLLKCSIGLCAADSLLERMLFKFNR
ncbi:MULTISPECIES: hypothetical protein [Methylotenera]|nr:MULTISPECIES: hypothetical protein [Methylotenera]